MGGGNLLGNISSLGSQAGIGVATPSYGQATTDAGQLASLGSQQTPVNQDSYKQYVDMQNMFGMEAGGPTMSYDQWAANTNAVNNRKSGLYGINPSQNQFGGTEGGQFNASPQSNTYTNNLNTAGTNFQSQYGTNPYVQAAQATTYGNIQGAQAATAANRVNQQTPFGSLTYQQTGTDAYGNPTYTANQTYSPEVMQGLAGLTGQIGQNINQGFNPNLPSTGIDAGQTYSDAIMKRLEPLQQRQSNQLQAQLANQGIMQGSEAYNNAMTDFNQKQNDQLTSAIVGGMQTGLQANQQAYNQALQNYNLPLSQLGSYRSATAPTYVNPYSQAAVSGPDIYGAYTSSNAADIERMKAQAQQQAALTGGLFQLGSNVLSNPNATSAIASGLGTLGSALGKLIP